MTGWPQQWDRGRERRYATVDHPRSRADLAMIDMAAAIAETVRLCERASSLDERVDMLAALLGLLNYFADAGAPVERDDGQLALDVSGGVR